MRHIWNGVVNLAVACFLLVIYPVSTNTGIPAGKGDSQTELFPAMRDRVRRHGHVTSTPTPSGWTSRCGTQEFSNVSAQELKRNYRLASVKDDILRKLKMNTPPNITGRIPDVPAMQNLLHQINSGAPPSGTDSMQVDRVSPTNVILLSQSVPAERRSGFPGSCYFAFSSELSNDRIISAQLGIYIHARNFVRSVPHRAGSTPATWILVYKIGRNSHGGLEKVLYRRRKLYLTAQHTGRWLFFDAKGLVELWMRRPEQNYGVQVIAFDLQGEPLAALPSATNENEHASRPYIDIQILSQPLNRSRRSTEIDCVEAGAYPRCCRYPLRIDFEEFGWDWVIAPKRYEAYYCSGECPFLFRQRQTHTHVVGQVVGGLGVPCCYPTLMSSLHMLYIDSNKNIVFGTLPAMIVERCGCS